MCISALLVVLSQTHILLFPLIWPNGPGKILFHHQKKHFGKLKSLQTWEIVKGPNDSFIKRKLKPATAWRKWRWNCRELRKEKFYQPKRKQKFPKSCFCLLQKKKGERAWKLCWLMLFLWLTVSGTLIVWMSFNNRGKTDYYLLYIRGLQCRSLALLQYNA